MVNNSNMANSDNTYGTYNKQTKIISQNDIPFSTNDGFYDKTVHADVEAAKTFFFTTEALAIWDECCTNLQWALVADDDGNNTKLKITFDFGTKGGNIATADDWAGQYNSRKTTLLNAGQTNWLKTGEVATSTDHLF